MMATTFSKQHKYAFCLDYKDVSSLYTTISGWYEDVWLSFSCSDDSKITTKDLSILEKFENLSTRAIINLKISGRNQYPNENRTELAFDTSIFNSPISLEILEADDSKAVVIKTEIEKRILAIRPWYWLFSKFNVYTVFFGLGFVYTCIQGSYSLFVSKKVEVSSANVHILDFGQVIIVIFVLMAAALFLLEIGRKFLFPSGIYLIGKEISRNDRRCKIRQWFITAVALGIPLSLGLRVFIK